MAVLAATAAPAATISQAEQGVFSRAYVIHAPAFEEDVGVAETSEPVPFNASLATEATLGLSLVDAHAELDSSIVGAQVTAFGEARTGLSLIDTGRHADAPADAFFEVVLDVAGEDEPFALSGRVVGFAIGGEGFAAVELVDAATDEVLAAYVAQAGERRTFAETGLLSVGSYRFTAFAIAHAGTEDASAYRAGFASFDAVLTVPEPSAPFQRAAGVATLALLLVSRRRRVSR